MNQGLESNVNDAHQTLKYTKAKMREILAQIEANHEQPLDTRVSIVLDMIHLLGLITPNHRNTRQSGLDCLEAEVQLTLRGGTHHRPRYQPSPNNTDARGDRTRNLRGSGLCRS